MKRIAYSSPRKAGKVNAINEATDLMRVIRSDDFLVLDTETTGLTSESEIVSIAIINSKGETLINQLVKPMLPIPPDATRIHGITNEMVANYFRFPADEIKDIVQGKQVIIYNCDYDLAMLYRSAKAARQEYVEWDKIATWHCAMKHFARIYGDWDYRRHSFRWQKLSTACAYYNIQQESAHGALVDCQNTLKVCKEMVKPIKDLPL